ncbi:MAG: Gfo/Idh/MocA family oxidoreductase [Elusimicrobia bacterium]|nr:Gfo/Idh/MocA family oxidoreductase [Elusimicrobiota bacterium]
MSKQINVGLIGAGWPAWQHIKGYQKIEGVKVLALCDLNEELLDKIANEYNIPKKFTKLEEMLALDELDAVSVCTPNFLHVPQIIKVLESGKHVICEKPLSINAEEAEKIAGPLAKSKKIFMIAQVCRFGSEAQYLKKLIDKNELGKIYYAKVKLLRRHGIPGIGSWFTTKKCSGGGSLIDIGVHAIDLAWWEMGCPEPVEVFGATYDEFGSKGLRDSGFGQSKRKGTTFDVEDLAVGLIKFKNGATLSLEISWALNISENTQNISVLCGTEGGAEFSPLKLIKYIEGSPSVIVPEIREDSKFDEQAKHFIDCIRNNKKPIVSLEQGITMLKMFDGLYKSAETNKSVAIKFG